MAGFVKPRAYLSSDTVRLTGIAGTEIMKTVTISPSQENPFKITEINAEKGENSLNNPIDPVKAEYRDDGKPVKKLLGIPVISNTLFDNPPKGI